MFLETLLNCYVINRCVKRTSENFEEARAIRRELSSRSSSNTYDVKPAAPDNRIKMVIGSNKRVIYISP